MGLRKITITPVTPPSSLRANRISSNYNDVYSPSSNHKMENQVHDDDDDISSSNDDEISRFRIALPQILAVSVKNLLLIGFGMTLGFPTIVIPAIQGGEGRYPDEDKEFFLNKEEISWFSSINLICVPLGCIFSGALTQPIGRRRAMQFVNFPIMAAWLLFYFSTNIYHLYGGLCLAGLSGGLLEAPVLTYVAEITQPHVRGMLAATGSFCTIFGVFIQFLLGSFLKWRTIALISSLLPVVAVIALFFVPESPHWLIRKNRLEDAKKSLAWLRGWVPFEKVEEEYNDLYHTLITKPQETGQADKTCLQKVSLYIKKDFLRPYALISLTFFIGHFSGMTTLQTYAVQIFHTLKAPIDKYYATMLLGVVELCGTLICVVLVHFTGKRPLVFISTIGCGLCFLSTATYAYFLNSVPGAALPNIVANISDINPQINLIFPNDNDTEINNVIHLSSVLNTTTDFPQYEVDPTIKEALMLEPDYDLHGDEDDNGTFLSDGIFLSDNLLDNPNLSVNDTDYENKNDTEIDLALSSAELIPKDVIVPLPKQAENKYLWVPLTLLLGSALLSHSGIRLIPWLLIGELFPATVRSGASGLSGGTGYLFGFLANKLFLTMIGSLTLPGTFWLYSAISLTGALILYFVLPETEGHTLAHIEEHFIRRRRKSSRKHKHVGNLENVVVDERCNISRNPDRVLVPNVTNLDKKSQIILNDISKTNNSDKNINKSNQIRNSDTSPQTFDISNWESDKIFQKHLEEHQNWIKHNNKRRGRRIPRNVEKVTALGVKKNRTNSNNRKQNELNSTSSDDGNLNRDKVSGRSQDKEQDVYDTSL